MLTSFLPVVLFSTLARGFLTPACDSYGINDGNNFLGWHNWRASTEDCAAATNQIEAHFGQAVGMAHRQCLSAGRSGHCEVSVCNPSDTERMVPAEAVWIAARLIHARHKSDGKVAGYISLDDPLENFQVFVQVSSTGSPNASLGASGRRRSLFSREEDEDGLEYFGLDAYNTTEWQTLGDRAEGDDIPTPEDDRRALSETMRHDIGSASVHTNLRMAMGGMMPIPRGTRPSREQIRERTALAHQDWDRAADERDGHGRVHNVVVPHRGIRLTPDERTIYLYEFAAHNNHNIRDIRDGEREAILENAVNEHERMGWQAMYAEQIRRGTQTMGMLLIRAFAVGMEGLMGTCG